MTPLLSQLGLWVSPAPINCIWSSNLSVKSHILSPASANPCVSFFILLLQFQLEPHYALPCLKGKLLHWSLCLHSAYPSYPKLQINHPEAQLQSPCPPPVIKLESASPSLKLSTNPSSCHSSNFPNELQHIYSHFLTIYYPTQPTWKQRNQESSRTGERIIKSRSGPTAKKDFSRQPLPIASVFSQLITL